METEPAGGTPETVSGGRAPETGAAPHQRPGHAQDDTPAAGTPADGAAGPGPAGAAESRGATPAPGRATPGAGGGEADAPVGDGALPAPGGRLAPAAMPAPPAGAPPWTGGRAAPGPAADVPPRDAVSGRDVAAAPGPAPAGDVAGTSPAAAGVPPGAAYPAASLPGAGGPSSASPAVGDPARQQPQPGTCAGPAGPPAAGATARPAGQQAPEAGGWGPPPAVRPPRAADAAAWNRQRLLLGIAAGVVILLLAGGLGVGALLYARATTPRADTPAVTVDNYLRALLVDRSIADSRALACARLTGLHGIEDLRDEALDRERVSPDGRVQITWGALVEVPQGPDRVTVETDVTVMGVFDSQVRSRRIETWRFGLVRDGDWRVCTAEKL